LLFQIFSAIGRASAPTEAAHSIVPAGIAPTCCGSSYNVAQHSPFPPADPGSATVPTWAAPLCSSRTARG
jgi:hypothetical protein